MKLQFVQISKSKGAETSKVIYTWHCVPEEQVGSVCQNFMDGFLYAMDTYQSRELRRPSCMVMDGWWAQTWRYHDSDEGIKWEFQDGNGKGLYRWDLRNKAQ